MLHCDWIRQKWTTMSTNRWKVPDWPLVAVLVVDEHELDWIGFKSWIFLAVGKAIFYYLVWSGGRWTCLTVTKWSRQERNSQSRPARPLLWQRVSACTPSRWLSETVRSTRVSLTCQLHADWELYKVPNQGPSQVAAAGKVIMYTGKKIMGMTTLLPINDLGIVSAT